jgi:hypothetical protein
MPSPRARRASARVPGMHVERAEPEVLVRGVVSLNGIYKNMLANADVDLIDGYAKVRPPER